MTIAGFSCLVRRSGTPTAIATEACSLVTGSQYQITASARRVVDPEALWHLKDGTTTLAYSAISAVDFLSGKFTLVAPPSGALTFSGTYLPISGASEVFAEAKSFTINESNDLLDTSVFAGTTSVHASVRRKVVGIKDVSVSVESVASAPDLEVLTTTQNLGTTALVEVFFGSTAVPRFRGLCKIESIERNGSVDGLIETSVSFSIAQQRHDESGFVAGYTYTTG